MEWMLFPTTLNVEFPLYALALDDILGAAKDSLSPPAAQLWRHPALKVQVPTSLCTCLSTLLIRPISLH